MQLSWSCGTGGSHRSSHKIIPPASQSSISRPKSPSLAVEEPHNTLFVLLLPFPSDHHTQSWKLLEVNPAWNKHCLSLRARTSPCGLQPVAAWVVKKAQHVRNHWKGKGLLFMTQIYCYSPSPWPLEIPKYPGLKTNS